MGHPSNLHICTREGIKVGESLINLLGLFDECKECIEVRSKIFEHSDWPRSIDVR